MDIFNIFLLWDFYTIKYLEMPIACLNSVIINDLGTDIQSNHLTCITL